MGCTGLGVANSAMVGVADLAAVGVADSAVVGVATWAVAVVTVLDVTVDAETAILVTWVGGTVLCGDLVGETINVAGPFVKAGVALTSSGSITAWLGCWTMMCMSVEGRGAWSGTPPSDSSFGVITADNDIIRGLTTLAEFGVDPGLALERSFLLWCSFIGGGKFATRLACEREDFEGEVVGGTCNWSSSMFSISFESLGFLGCVEDSSFSDGLARADGETSMSSGWGGGDFIFLNFNWALYLARLDGGGLFNFREAELSIFSAASFAANSLELRGARNVHKEEQGKISRHGRM